MSCKPWEEQLRRENPTSDQRAYPALWHGSLDDAIFRVMRWRRIRRSLISGLEIFAAVPRALVTRAECGDDRPQPPAPPPLTHVSALPGNGPRRVGSVRGYGAQSILPPNRYQTLSSERPADGRGVRPLP